MSDHDRDGQPSQYGAPTDVCAGSSFDVGAGHGGPRRPHAFARSREIPASAARMPHRYGVAKRSRNTATAKLVFRARVAPGSGSGIRCGLGCGHVEHASSRLDPGAPGPARRGPARGLRHHAAYAYTASEAAAAVLPGSTRTSAPTRMPRRRPSPRCRRAPRTARCRSPTSPCPAAAATAPTAPACSTAGPSPASARNSPWSPASAPAR